MILLQSIFGGIFIAIGSYIYINNMNAVGAFLFSIGLVGILFFSFKLYTGYIGYVNNFKKLKTSLLILFGNFIGSMILLPYKNENAVNIIINKLDKPLYISFINAFICGILIYLAVEAWKNKKEWIVLLAIPAFILFGAEHSIADLCYFMCAKYFVIKFIPFIIIVIIGNALGSLSINKILEIKEKKHLW